MFDVRWFFVSRVRCVVLFCVFELRYCVIVYSSVALRCVVCVYAVAL